MEAGLAESVDVKQRCGEGVSVERVEGDSAAMLPPSLETACSPQHTEHQSNTGNESGVNSDVINGYDLWGSNDVKKSCDSLPNDPSELGFPVVVNLNKEFGDSSTVRSKDAIGNGDVLAKATVTNGDERPVHGGSDARSVEYCDDGDDDDDGCLTVSPGAPAGTPPFSSSVTRAVTDARIVTNDVTACAPEVTTTFDINVDRVAKVDNSKHEVLILPQTDQSGAPQITSSSPDTKDESAGGLERGSCSNETVGDNTDTKDQRAIGSPPTPKSHVAGDTLLNPFVHRIKYRFPYDYIKVAVLTLLLAPLRVLFILVSMAMAYVFSSLGLWGVSREQLRERPLTGWRGCMRWGMAFSGRFMTRSYGFHVLSVKGRLATQDQAPILVVAPHSSFFDGVAVYWSKVPGLVSRIENLDIPLFGKYIDYTQPVYVWRESTNSRQETIQEIRHRATSDENWPQVMVFPEGTCTNRSCLITFKPGAFYPGVPVQPIVIRYPNYMDTTTWTWDGPGALKLLWLTLCQFHSYCEIEYLPVYTPSEAEKKDAHLYAANVREVMAKALAVPVVDYTYDDCRLMHKARLSGLPTHVGLVEFQKLRQRFGVSMKDVEQRLVLQFAPMADHDGLVQLPRLARRLSVPPEEPALKHVFDALLAVVENDCISLNFREYLVAYYTVVHPLVLSDTTLHRVFALLDPHSTGCVTVDSIYEALGVHLALQIERVEAERMFRDVDVNGLGYVDFDSFKTAATSGTCGELVCMLDAYLDSVESGERQRGEYRRQSIPETAEVSEVGRTGGKPKRE